MFGFLGRLFGGGGRIAPAEAKAKVEAGAALIDVRSPAEFQSGHVPGALNIPVSEFAERLGEINTSKGVILYCRSGIRSARAAAMLRAQGHQDVHNLGSIAAWPGETA